LLSPPVPTPKVEPEPADVVVIPDSPPRELITAGLWPEWMEDIVAVPFAELGHQFQ